MLLLIRFVDQIMKRGRAQHLTQSIVNPLPKTERTADILLLADMIISNALHWSEAAFQRHHHVISANRLRRMNKLIPTFRATYTPYESSTPQAGNNLLQVMQADVLAHGHCLEGHWMTGLTTNFNQGT